MVYWQDYLPGSGIPAVIIVATNRLVPAAGSESCRLEPWAGYRDRLRPGPGLKLVVAKRAAAGYKSESARPGAGGKGLHRDNHYAATDLSAVTAGMIPGPGPADHSVSGSLTRRGRARELSCTRNLNTALRPPPPALRPLRRPPTVTPTALGP